MMWKATVMDELLPRTWMMRWMFCVDDDMDDDVDAKIDDDMDAYITIPAL